MHDKKSFKYSQTLIIPIYVCAQAGFLVDRLSIYFTKHNYKVSTSFLKESKRYKGFKIKKFQYVFNFCPSD